MNANFSKRLQKCAIDYAMMFRKYLIENIRFGFRMMVTVTVTVTVKLVGLNHITHMANRINEFICTLMQIKNHDLFIAFMT